MTKPSAREQDAFLRGEIDERLMKEVIKKFPGSRWADLASFQLLDNKVCGDWQGVAKCPEKEASMFEKYANEHPQSAKAAEALYAAAWRYSALIEIYKTGNDSKKSDESKSKAIALAQKIVSQFSQSDWGARSQRLLYLMQQNIPTYGNVEE
jgi:outer membrane protein assembly factor BamD (BamD/ComL family)